MQLSPPHVSAFFDGKWRNLRDCSMVTDRLLGLDRPEGPGVLSRGRKPPVPDPTILAKPRRGERNAAVAPSGLRVFALFSGGLRPMALKVSPATNGRKTMIPEHKNCTGDSEPRMPMNNEVPKLGSPSPCLLPSPRAKDSCASARALLVPLGVSPRKTGRKP